ncbi:MAG: RNA methyltransferase [Armatimonadetes bacterium]|nr:RNA methyltransferase [Armatimonadota bacterium]
MYSLSDTEHSQGILVIGESPLVNNLNKLKGSFFLILDGINDPGNLGTLIRTACGSAVDGIILGGNSASPYSPKTLRAASGVFNIPILETKELISDINKLKAQGFKIICADTSALKFHYEVSYTFPLGLVLGSEAHGISGEILNLADLKVKIPLYNQVESLNVAVAGGILLYEIIKNITKS